MHSGPQAAQLYASAEKCGSIGSGHLLGFQVKEVKFVKNAHFMYTDWHKIVPLSQLLERTIVGEMVPLASSVLSTAGQATQRLKGTRISQTHNCEHQEKGALARTSFISRSKYKTGPGHLDRTENTPPQSVASALIQELKVKSSDTSFTHLFFYCVCNGFCAPDTY